MAGLLLELRRKLAVNRQKSTYSSNAGVRQKPQTAKPAPEKPTLSQEAADAEDDFSDGEIKMHTVSTFERTQDIVSKDDFLLQQIDDFRNRAQQLQNLMNSKEEEVRQMEELRQQNALLQAESEQAREQDAKISEEQMQHIEQLLLKQDAGISEEQMQHIEQLLLKQDAKISEEQMQHIEQLLRRQDAGISEEQMQHIEQLLLRRDENTAELTAEVERKIDAMIAKVGAKLNELDASVRASTEGASSENRQRTEELKASLEQILSQLETIKAELSDKMHKENVICYRNIQDLFKNLDERIESLEPLEKKTDSLRHLVFIAMVFSLVNFVVGLGVLLLQLGVFI